MTNALHTLCNLYHYDCFHICKDLMEGENKHEYEYVSTTSIQATENCEMVLTIGSHFQM